MDRVAGHALALAGERDEELSALRASLDEARRASARFEEALTAGALARLGAPDATGHAERARVLLEGLDVELAPPV